MLVWQSAPGWLRGGPAGRQSQSQAAAASTFWASDCQWSAISRAMPHMPEGLAAGLAADLASHALQQWEGRALTGWEGEKLEASARKSVWESVWVDWGVMPTVAMAARLVATLAAMRAVQ